jgi:hypothetical protein
MIDFIECPICHYEKAGKILNPVRICFGTHTQSPHYECYCGKCGHTWKELVNA